MIAVDTNILIRFLTQDDIKQYKKALNLIKKYKIFIPDTVIQETEWVLRFAYKFEVDEICHAFTALFGLENIKINNPEHISNVIKWHKQGLDFSDAMHLSNSGKANCLYSFDKSFVKSAQKVSSCEVRLP